MERKSFELHKYGLLIGPQRNDPRTTTYQAPYLLVFFFLSCRRKLGARNAIPSTDQNDVTRVLGWTNQSTENGNAKYKNLVSVTRKQTTKKRNTHTHTHKTQ